MPGRSSKTPMFKGASRSAKSFATIEAPHFDTQYSPRSILAISAETEVTKEMDL